MSSIIKHILFKTGILTAPDPNPLLSKTFPKLCTNFREDKIKFRDPETRKGYQNIFLLEDKKKRNNKRKDCQNIFLLEDKKGRTRDRSQDTVSKSSTSFVFISKQIKQS